MKNHKANIDDGCNPKLVAGAEFDLPLGIPIIKAPSKIIIPPGITPFSMRDRAPSFDEAIGFYEMDVNFAEVLREPETYIDDFGRFAALISPDCSLYRDAPLSVQLTNIYRNRAIGGYYQRRGQYVIPQIRWGNEYTYTTKYFPEKIAFLGAEKHSILAIGTYGCFVGRENKYHFEAGLAAMMESLEPKVVLVYGPMPEKIFGTHMKYAQFIRYPDWTARMHGGE
ncbi:MAG: DUF4417 domain-containing protein [Clostridia bacterium]|nr:DUF4417 domain-containing protein [Clostridia bacterium]